MSRRIVSSMLLVILLVIFFWGIGARRAESAVDPAAKCEQRKLVAAGKAGKSLLKCYATAAGEGEAVDAGCLLRAETRLAQRFASEDLSGACHFTADATPVLAIVDALASGLGASLSSVGQASQCAKRKIRAAAIRTDRVLKAEGKHSLRPEKERLAAGMLKAADRFDRNFARGEAGSDCVTTGDADAVGTEVDTGAAAVVDVVRGVLKDLSPGPLVGAAVRADVLSSDDEAYRETLLRHFNSVTVEFELMWGNLEPVQGAPDFGPADTTIDLAEQHGLAVKGAPLLWHMIVPSWLQDLSDTELEDAVNQRITDVVGRYAGRVRSWDVVNEAVNFDGTMSETIFHQRLGPDYIAEAFLAAHAADPDALLFYNDFLAEPINPKSDGILEMVEALLAQGVPIHGVGFQAHIGGGIFGFGDNPAGSFRQNLQRFADLGLLVNVSELDVQMRTFDGSRAHQLLRQGEIYNTIVADCLAVPACDSITFWGVTDRYTWIRDYLFLDDWPLPFDEDYVPKPAFFGVRNALIGP